LTPTFAKGQVQKGRPFVGLEQADGIRPEVFPQDREGRLDDGLGLRRDQELLRQVEEDGLLLPAGRPNGRVEAGLPEGQVQEGCGQGQQGLIPVGRREEADHVHDAQEPVFVPQGEGPMTTPGARREPFEPTQASAFIGPDRRERKGLRPEPVAEGREVGRRPDDARRVPDGRHAEASVVFGEGHPGKGEAGFRPGSPGGEGGEDVPEESPLQVRHSLIRPHGETPGCPTYDTGYRMHDAGYRDAYPVCVFSGGQARSSVLGVRPSVSIRYQVLGPRFRVPGTRQGNRAIRQ
jgi:hypothetical protein